VPATGSTTAVPSPKQAGPAREGCGTAEYSRYQLAVCLLRRTDRDRLREFGIHESDGAPDEKEGRPKHQHLVTKLHDGAVKGGLGVSSHLTQAHRAVPS
jgi:hypothetical protein